MSYCRWSSDDSQCDLYVYESDEGFMIHVARSRIVFRESLPPPVPDDADVDARLARARWVSRLVREGGLVPLGLPCDGQTFVEPCAGAAAARVEELAAMGYRVPASVAQRLREEATAHGRQ